MELSVSKKVHLDPWNWKCVVFLSDAVVPGPAPRRRGPLHPLDAAQQPQGLPSRRFGAGSRRDRLGIVVAVVGDAVGVEEDDAEDALRAVVVDGVESGRHGAGPVFLPLLLLHGILRGSE